MSVSATSSAQVRGECISGNAPPLTLIQKWFKLTAFIEIQDRSSGRILKGIIAEVIPTSPKGPAIRIEGYKFVVHITNIGYYSVRKSEERTFVLITGKKEKDKFVVTQSQLNKIKFFDRMFSGSFRDTSDISQFISAEQLKLLLPCIDGKVPITYENVIDIFYLADFYEAEELLQRAKVFLLKNLTKEEISDCLSNTDLHISVRQFLENIQRELLSFCGRENGDAVDRTIMNIMQAHFQQDNGEKQVFFDLSGTGLTPSQQDDVRRRLTILGITLLVLDSELEETEGSQLNSPRSP